MEEKILAINPGSTSTKLALFEGERLVFKENVVHDEAALARYPRAADQLELRLETIRRILAERQVDLRGFAAFVGRGGGLTPCPGGVYEVDEKLISDALGGKNTDHPACLGCAIADGFARQYGGKAYIVDPPDTDEFQEVARITGIKGIYRMSHTHALNQKETARRAAAELGLDYRSANLIVAHLGGGVSVAAHCRGRMVDANDNINGDGPMAPTRAGALPVKDVMDLCCSGTRSPEALYRLMAKEGGFLSHLGTSEATQVAERAKGGDAYARLVYEAFQYQVGKRIGAMAAVMKGRVDAIVLTGGIAYDQVLTEHLREMVGFLAPVLVRPGELELEALAAGALRVLRGEEAPRHYTGQPVFSGFPT
ncbi:butyrate kinase [Lawsonibacter celer]|uniref:butyrate kinase n=1 Tax=Lawsonibacter celer TaxID=2986526 RepID=UPI0016440528|nr:butyrate kinase [Lawsonibacter celer]